MSKPTVSERIAHLEQRFDKHEEFLNNGLSSKIAGIVATQVAATVKPDIEFIRGKLEGLREPPPPPTRRQITFRQIIEVGLVALIFCGVLGAVLLLAIGKMDLDDAVKLITALRGSG